MNDNAKRWVEALRSGEYEQGRNWLRRGDRYCCLGVACDIAADDLGLERTSNGWRGGRAYLPPVVQRWLGLATRMGEFIEPETGWQGSLVVLNDKFTPFAEIADLIEAEPEGLFA